MRRKIVVGVTGASGSIYAKVLLAKLALAKEVEIAVVMSDNAQDVWKYELDNKDYLDLPFKRYEPKDYYAPFASGSSSYDTLIICPCSMGTLGRIAAGTSDNLIARAADVMLKEKRKLICAVRDTPYNTIHINNMKTVADAGGIICPASPSYYSKPKTFEDLASTVVDRILSLADISHDGYRWSE